ncbi:HD domain-containing protein [Hahella sp. CR1]|uniref:HD domain-containing protein n=1 Tax=Hahella sp. CR1 TaxID=2992807 RepID=UPI00244310D3|nr:HD domain-containing protein [Hahella sp. CR1]MDG9668965.1 HD domain-containing protein [Hahella sp. CR1]
MKVELQKIFSFIIELEKLKSVNRMTKVIGTDRRENSAEHSWQIAVLAMSLESYAKEKVDINRVVRMLLLHDVVEIDAGDKFVFSAAHADTENEMKAAERIFGMLPSEVGNEFKALWLEYEERRTPESRYAYAMDRLMPVLINLNNGCQSWVENGVRLEQVLSKTGILADFNEALWEMISGRLHEAHQKGFLG